MSDGYFRPSVTVDVMAIRCNASDLELLLIQRSNDPFAGAWALPGGFIEPDESLESSARRELLEETQLEVSELYWLGAYGEPGRDPRGRTITLAYYALFEHAQQQVQGGDDAQEARWFKLSQLPELAFDHAQIVRDGLQSIQQRLDNTHPQGKLSVEQPQMWRQALQAYPLV